MFPTSWTITEIFFSVRGLRQNFVVAVKAWKRREMRSYFMGYATDITTYGRAYVNRRVPYRDLVDRSRGNRRSDARLPCKYLYRPCSVIRATLQRPARDTISRPSTTSMVAARVGTRRLKPRPRLTLTYAHRHNNGSGAWECIISRACRADGP